LVHSSIDLPQTRIAGSVGTGDAFAAGVILGIHEGVEMEIGITYGVCAAAACLLDPTTSNGIKPLPDCLKLGDEFGYRPELKL
jgi:sugar/nucleoside kinase (ribokinase family)